MSSPLASRKQPRAPEPPNIGRSRYNWKNNQSTKRSRFSNTNKNGNRNRNGNGNGNGNGNTNKNAVPHSISELTGPIAANPDPYEDNKYKLRSPQEEANYQRKKGEEYKRMNPVVVNPWLPDNTMNKYFSRTIGPKYKPINLHKVLGSSKNPFPPRTWGGRRKTRKGLRRK
jgi:hypothetical protein